MGEGRRRREEARRAMAAGLAGEHPEWSDRRCEQEAERELRLHDDNPHFADQWLRVRPQVTLPKRAFLAPEVEARAMVEHPSSQWLLGDLGRWDDGRPAERLHLIAGLLHMVDSSRPDFKEALRSVALSPNLMWAYRVPVARAPTSAAYATLHAMVRRRPAGMCIHANLAMVLELAELVRTRGSTDPLRDLAVDGTLIPANVPQRAPRGRSPRERKVSERRIAGPDRPMAQYVVYQHGRIIADAVRGHD